MPQLHEDSTDFILSKTVRLLTFIWRCENIWIAHYHSDGWDLETKVIFSARAPQVTRPNTMWHNLWGYVKDAVFVQPSPTDIPELQRRITEAVATLLKTYRRRSGKKWNIELTTADWLLELIPNPSSAHRKLSEILYRTVCIPSIINAYFNFYEVFLIWFENFHGDQTQDNPLGLSAASSGQKKPTFRELSLAPSSGIWCD
jgi:hypothetical protein